MLIEQRDEDAVFITLPADHLITEKKKFLEAVDKAFDFASKQRGLVTFGIQPTRPDTGYGYININNQQQSDGIFPVIRFVEKPNLETAENYLASGDYLWNSGIFIWRADIVLQEISKFLPGLYSGLQHFKGVTGEKLTAVLADVYPKLPDISIDYGIMEKSERVFLVKGMFDWNDVGSWETVYQLHEKDENGNALAGNVFLKKTANSYVYSPHRFTALLGIDNAIVITTDDAVLVCSRENVQDVRSVVDYLKEQGREDLV
jgi:mannose-1-phosphate guanylyltransferase